MARTDVVEYRLLSADAQSALGSLLSEGLRNTTLLQLLQLSTGFSQAFSVFAVYREDDMTFEVSAELSVCLAERSLQVILHDLVEDADFRNRC